ncbi:MAG TPA: transporter [Deltaproteobacteria bacterium]|nr:transporter [Deltaproteobacteria bacterium]
MKTRTKLCYFSLILLVFIPSVVFGNGFATNEQSIRAIGRGGAFAAQADDPSAVYYNPAGIVQLEGTQATGGVSFIIPTVNFKSSVNNTTLNTTVGKETDLEDNIFAIPNFYITHKLFEQWSLGFGAFSNFGLGTDWPDDWEGRFLIGGTEANLSTFTLNPVVAYRPIQKLSLSAGVVFQYLNIELKNKRFTGTASEPNQKLEGDNWQVGWNVGALFWLTDEVRLGASYRSRVDHSIDDGTFDITGILNTGATADLELPAVLYLGVNWTRDALSLEFNAHWTEWSTYEKLEVLLDTGSTILSEKDWKDVWAYRFGAEYKLNEMFDLRAGLVYDESPIPDRTLDILVPSGDRWLFTGGLGVHYNKWNFDFAYNFVLDEDRTVDNNAGVSAAGTLRGEFKDGYTHVFGFNVSYKF